MEIEIGVVEHYFGKLGVAAIKINNEGFKVGDTLHFLGHTTDFKSRIDSMQIEHQKVDQAKPGDAIGLKVSEKVRPGDKVFLVREE